MAIKWSLIIKTKRDSVPFAVLNNDWWQITSKTCHRSSWRLSCSDINSHSSWKLPIMLSIFVIEDLAQMVVLHFWLFISHLRWEQSHHPLLNSVIVTKLQSKGVNGVSILWLKKVKIFWLKLFCCVLHAYAVGWIFLLCELEVPFLQ